MKTILILPDGIGLRNFIMTQFLSILSKNGEVIIWHDLPHEIMQNHLNDLMSEARWIALPHHHEGQFPYFFRRSRFFAQLYKQKEPGTDIILQMSLGRGKGIYRLRNLIPEFFAKFFSHTQSQILWLDKAHARSVEREAYFKRYLDLLIIEQPDIVFCSHQRSEIAVPAMLAARKLGIPTATFIYSWDNLPKGRMAVHADNFLVWSEHMRDEMFQYYQEIPKENIHIVGTPQFEHYFNLENIEPRDIFLGRFGLDPSRPIICFSGDDIQVSPHDPDYLEDLTHAVNEIPLENRPQIIFRSSPTDVTGRYKSTLTRHPEIANIKPAWINLAENDWSKVIPTKDDIRLLVNTVHHCDLVVNVGSTMALDFAINQKPAVYLAYPPASWHSEEIWKIENVYRFPHFKQIQKYNPVSWARDRNDLKGIIEDCLRNPERLEPNRIDWVNFLVKTPLEQASQRCAEALANIVSEKKH
jgi:hypothetical protein